MMSSGQAETRQLQVARRNAPPGHVEREMTRLHRARELNGVAQWDLPHYLVPVHWDGRKLWTGSAHEIPHDVHPKDHPNLYARLSGEDAEPQAAMVREGRAATLYGYMLVAEMFGISVDLDVATQLDRRRYQRDTAERRYHERPDAQESCMVMAADIDGRFWRATRYRSEPKRLLREFWQGPDALCITKDARRKGARFPEGASTLILTRIATALAVVLYGDRRGQSAGGADVVPLRQGSGG